MCGRHRGYSLTYDFDCSAAGKQLGKETLDIINPSLERVVPLPLRDKFGNDINQAAHEREDQNEKDPNERSPGSNRMNCEYHLQNDSANSHKVGHFALSFLAMFLLGGDSLARTVEQLAPNIHDFFFPFTAAFARFSFTLNFTILPIKSYGIGLSNGNWTEPFAPS